MKLATLFCLALLPALAAQDPAPRPAAAARSAFVLEAGEVKLTEFVDRCAQHLGWNILSSQPELQSCPLQEIRTQTRIEVDREGCIELLSSMLARAGFVLTELDAPKGIYEILSTTGPRGREIGIRAVRRTPEEILAKPMLRMPVSTVVELQHTNATLATNALRPFFASVGGAGTTLTIGSTGNGGTLLLQGLQDQVATAIQLVREADVVPAPGTDMFAPDRIAKLEQRIEALEKRLADRKGDEEAQNGDTSKGR